MGCLAVLFVFPFITLPSIIYSISHFALAFILTWMIVPFNLSIGKRSPFLRERAAIQADRIAVKLVPIFLIIAVPIILYFYTWELAGWIFFGWMIVYFLSRRFSGASQTHTQITQQRKEAENIIDSLEEQINDRNQPKKMSKEKE